MGGRGRERERRTDVWVVDLGQEAHFGRGHRVFFWEKELELEHAICGRPRREGGYVWVS